MLAFIGAMSLEVEEILKRMTDVEKKVISNVDFYEGKLAGIECVVMKSGIAKVAAAISTTILFEHFDINGVINIGTAGGLDPRQEVLDVVISERVAHHDIDVPGPDDDWPKGFNQDKTCYQADQGMLDVLKEITKDSKERVWFGNIATGDCFIYREDQIQRIQADYPGALCAEMEGAAIGQVCRQYNCPFVIIRSLSDITHKENNEMTFDEYAVKASERSAMWCERFITNYSK